MKQRDLFEREPDPWELDDVQQLLVATVVFTMAPFGEFDYQIPSELEESLQAGCRVRVPFGQRNRYREAYCIATGVKSVDARKLKAVHSQIDRSPLVSATMLRLTRWISDYYLSPHGQVLEGVVPAGVRGQAGTREVTLLSVPTSVAARLTQLKLPPKQAHALKVLAGSPRPLTPAQLAQVSQVSTAPIQQLRKKQLVKEVVERVYSHQIEEKPAHRESPRQLNDEQQVAFDEINGALQSRVPATILLQGVTGSGKTEVYMQAIEQVISYGRQAIVLVPEISLTPQTRERFRARFDRVAVLHSHLSDIERHWHWQQIASGQVQVVVGARSAVFAPTPQLGLIVLDEEHDSSFKQDSVPRYHARLVAEQRSQLERFPLVLGSATPSLESWHHAKTGRYKLSRMTQRVYDRPLPDVVTIDLRDQVQGPRGAISRQLHVAIRDALRDEGQVILLLNRRGFSTSIQCPACGFVVKCNDCELPLTHHRETEQAICHYCEFQVPTPTSCPNCDFTGIRYSGLGTQKLEAEVKARFPDITCLRMDSDTMKGANSHEQALARFRSGEVKILLGTQMIAKGLDFPDVTLVGVINADTALHLPDFRAGERTFQLVTQVAGRTGRGEKGGRVLVQTFNSDHPAIQAAARHDYLQFAEGELPLREEYGYPPSTVIIRVVIRGPGEELTKRFAELVGEYLRERNAELKVRARMMGPAPAPVAKLRGKYRFHILTIGSSADALKSLIAEAFEKIKPPEHIAWIADVDPVDMQ